MKENLEILCPGCGKETLIKKEPIYNGFKKIGEQFKCISCGYLFEDKAKIPFKEISSTPKIFNIEKDLPQKPRLFTGDENARLCRYCQHYVVNPFKQYCGLHNKEVEATDTCDKFEPKK